MKKKQVQDANVTQQSHVICQVLRQECVQRVGFDSKRLRICSQHKVVPITKRVPLVDIQGKQRWTLVLMFVPEAANYMVASNQATKSEVNKKDDDSIDTLFAGGYL